MANGEVIAYNIASFICALFVLEFGADKFIDHTAVVGRRTGIPQSVIALLTAGAEWEELAVVVISVARGRSSLAIGNIIGSTISNILGAFSLGLLFLGTDQIVFDKSSKLYCLLLLLLTVLIAGLAGFGRHLLWKVVGAVMTGIFAAYIATIAWTIAKGVFNAPELSDSDSDSDSDSGSDGDNNEQNALETGVAEQTGSSIRRRAAGTCDHPNTTNNNSAEQPSSIPMVSPVWETETVTQIAQGNFGSSAAQLSQSETSRRRRRGPKHSLRFHLALLILGFLAVILSAYVLSNAATNLADEFGMSDVLFGVVILSIATTLPEKFIAVISGSRGHAGIMVANTVGSNIFLLSLVIGVLWVSTGGEYDQGSTNAIELGVMLGSTVAMTLTVWLDLRWTRWIGAAMLIGYIAFLVLEFTLIRKV